MKILVPYRWWTAAFVATIAFFGFIHVAAANNSARFQQQIEQFKEMLQEQAEADENNLTEKDRAQTEAWIQEAEVLLANGRHEAVSRRLRRVEYSLDLIRALNGAVNIDTLAERQEAYFHTSKERIAQFEAEMRELQQKKANLERELERLRR